MAPEDLYALLGPVRQSRITSVAKAQQVLDSAIVESAYVDGRLVGVTWAVGDGTHYLVPVLYVHPDFRNQGIGTRLRLALIDACEGPGVIYGFYGDTGFWDKVPGTKNLRSYTGMREIE